MRLHVVRVYAFAAFVTPVALVAYALANTPRLVVECWQAALYETEVQPWVRWVRGRALVAGPEGGENE